MKKLIIMLITASFLWGLSPEAERDQYLQKWAEAVKAKEYKKAESYFSKIDILVRKHGVKTPIAYDYFKASTYFNTDNAYDAYAYAEKYIERSGQNGEFYTQALEILTATKSAYEVTLNKKKAEKTAALEEAAKAAASQKAQKEKAEEAARRLEIQEKKKNYANHTVRDRETGLEWQDDYDVIINKFSFDEAEAYCADLTLDGKNDWRMPTLSELLSTYDYSRYDAANGSAIKPPYLTIATTWADKKFRVYSEYGEILGPIADQTRSSVRCVRTNLE